MTPRMTSNFHLSVVHIYWSLFFVVVVAAGVVDIGYVSGLGGATFLSNFISPKDILALFVKL